MYLEAVRVVSKPCQVVKAVCTCTDTLSSVWLCMTTALLCSLTAVAETQRLVCLRVVLQLLQALAHLQATQSACQSNTKLSLLHGVPLHLHRARWKLIGVCITGTELSSKLNNSR